MNNSTLLCLFFISIGLPLTCASSSPKPKKDTLTLVDDTNTAQAVQPEGPRTLEQTVPEKSLVPEADKVVKLSRKQAFKDVDKRADEIGNEKYLGHLCKVLTTLGQFKGLSKFLKKRNMISGFLAGGNIKVVRKVITETKLLATGDDGSCDSIYKAIAISLIKDSHERAMSLFEAANERPAWKEKFERFVSGFFKKYHPWTIIMPLKRFLTFHGKELGDKYPVILETIFLSLKEHMLKSKDSSAAKLLTDFVAQPFLVTPVSFANVFLRGNYQFCGDSIIKYVYKEAIEEGLKEEYYYSQSLWEVIKKEYPTRFSGKYPKTDIARANVLKDLPTKQDREEEWAEKHAPLLSKHLREIFPSEFPKRASRIVAKYAITWVDLIPGFIPQKLTSEARDQVIEQLKVSIDDMYEVAELGVGIDSKEFLSCVCPLITTFLQHSSIMDYFDQQEVIPSLLLHGNMAFVKQAIVKFKDEQDPYHIHRDFVYDAIAVSLQHDVYVRAVALMEAFQEILGNITEFENFMRDFFVKHTPEVNSLTFKRFLTLYGEKLNADHPNILEHFCLFLVYDLKHKLAKSDSQTLLGDFVGQPSLLSSTALARGFLWHNNDDYRRNFVKYGWQEAIREGLTGSYAFGREKLWAVMMRERSTQFSALYPRINDAHEAALEKYPTKLECEKDWFKKNSQLLFERLEQLMPGILPKVLWGLVFEYEAITWILTLGHNFQEMV